MGKSTLCIECFDFDSSKKIENGKAEIKNVDNKTIEKCTIVNGKVILNVNKECVADFYSVYLIDDDGNKHYPFNLATKLKEVNGQNVLTHTTQKLITPRSYAKCNAKLYFKSCESPTNQYKVGIIKCYKVPNDDKYIARKKQEAYNYCTDSKDEIFVADCTQMIALQAYFYNDLEKDKLLSQKSREILSNETMQSCVNLNEMQWFINDIELNGESFRGNPIFVNLKDFGFKNDDILTIKAKLKSQKDKYIIEKEMPYKEPFKADGNLLIDDREKDKIYRHKVIHALGEMRLAIEDRYALVYDYRGLFLYENRCEVCELNINNDINDTNLKNLNDYIDFKKNKYDTKITADKNNTFSVTILDESGNSKRPIGRVNFNFNENIQKLLYVKQKIHFIYHKPTQYVIFINRHTQTTKYTLSNYQILKRKDNGKYELVAQEVAREQIAEGIILEPCGPDGLLADTVLRIPQGHYKIIEKGTKMESLRTYYSAQGLHSNLLPKLYDDEFVLSDNSNSKKRTDILIHAGTNVLESPLDRTEGCLLIGKEFKNGELVTHNNTTINLLEAKEKLNNIAKEKKSSLTTINNKKLNKTKKAKEIERLNDKLYKEYGKHYENNIEPYINASIRMLMAFIKENTIKSKDGKNKYENFSIHIKNNFGKGECNVRMG